MPSVGEKEEAISTTVAAGTNSTDTKSTKSSIKTPTLTPPNNDNGVGKKVVSKSVTTAIATSSSSSSSTQNATDRISSVVKLPPTNGAAPPRRPSIKIKPNRDTAAASDLSDMDITTIPPLKDISQEMWNEYTTLRKYVITKHYHYDSIKRFEKYALGSHPQEELGSSGPQWTRFSNELECPDYGFYIVKLPYINGTYLVLFGMSLMEHAVCKGHRKGGLYKRLREHHAGHGVAGEVITIAGDMRGGIKFFEDAMKVTFLGFVPKIVDNNGNDVHLNGHETLMVPSSEVADSVAMSIVDWSNRIKTTGSLSIPACFGNPSGATISLDEGAKNFVRNHPVYKKMIGGARSSMSSKRDENIVAVMITFQNIHGPKTRPFISGSDKTNNPLYTVSNQIEYDLKRYRGTFKGNHQPLDPKMLELYRNKFKLIEFQLSPAESIKTKLSSKVHKKDFKEGDGSGPCGAPHHHSCKNSSAPRPPLEDAAAAGCRKCQNELKTGVKTKKGHDDDCPRKYEAPTQSEEEEETEESKEAVSTS